MKSRIASSLALAALLATPAAGNEFAGALRALAETELAAWTREPAVLAAVREQNAAHAALGSAEIDALDQTWRAEIGAGATPMIDEVLARPGSQMLMERVAASGGLITEVFVTDRHGLNVIQSGITSDFWQGDEEKFTESFGKPAGTVHIGGIELDESTQTYQSQVSFPIHDPESDTAIGSVTFGINLELLD